MRRSLWYLKNPMRLSIELSQRNDGLVQAVLPALPGCDGLGDTIDAAILSLAKAMQKVLEGRNGTDTQRDS